ncbi:hypothetical protein GVAV_002757 [Gurleya vavrai]
MFLLYFLIKLKECFSINKQLENFIQNIAELSKKSELIIEPKKVFFCKCIGFDTEYKLFDFCKYFKKEFYQKSMELCKDESKDLHFFQFGIIENKYARKDFFNENIFDWYLYMKQKIYKGKNSYRYKNFELFKLKIIESMINVNIDSSEIYSKKFITYENCLFPNTNSLIYARTIYHLFNILKENKSNFNFIICLSLTEKGYKCILKYYDSLIKHLKSKNYGDIKYYNAEFIFDFNFVKIIIKNFLTSKLYLFIYRFIIKNDLQDKYCINSESMFYSILENSVYPKFFSLYNFYNSLYKNCDRFFGFLITDYASLRVLISIICTAKYNHELFDKILQKNHTVTINHCAIIASTNFSQKTILTFIYIDYDFKIENSYYIKNWLYNFKNLQEKSLKQKLNVIINLIKNGDIYNFIYTSTIVDTNYSNYFANKINLMSIKYDLSICFAKFKKRIERILFFISIKYNISNFFLIQKEMSNYMAYNNFYVKNESFLFNAKKLNIKKLHNNQSINLFGNYKYGQVLYFLCEIYVKNIRQRYFISIIPKVDLLFIFYSFVKNSTLIEEEFNKKNKILVNRRVSLKYNFSKFASKNRSFFVRNHCTVILKSFCSKLNIIVLLSFVDSKDHLEKFINLYVFLYYVLLCQKVNFLEKRYWNYDIYDLNYVKEITDYTFISNWLTDLKFLYFDKYIDFIQNESEIFETCNEAKKLIKETIFNIKKEWNLYLKNYSEAKDTKKNIGNTEEVNYEFILYVKAADFYFENDQTYELSETIKKILI